MKSELQKRLDLLWATIVENYEIDMLRHRIVFDLLLHEHEVESRHSLVFEQVSAFHYSAGHSALEYEEDDIMELTAAYHEPEGREYNFELELFSKKLEIQAVTVV